MTKHNEHAPGDARRAGTDLVALGPDGPFALTQPAAAAHPAGDELGREPMGFLGLYLHAFRRHWALAIILGLVCGAAAGVPAWLLYTEKYTAVSLLQISANEKPLMFQTIDRASTAGFETFKGTQQQLFTSDVVLVAALRRPEAQGLAVIEKENDPVRWLAGRIRVEFPGNAEIMRVSLTHTQPDEAAVLVAAVVDAYMKESVGAEKEHSKQRLKDLDELYSQKEADMRTARTELRSLAEQLGNVESGALALKQRIAYEQYGEARSELSHTRLAIRHAQDELKVRQARLAASKQTPHPADELQSYIDELVDEFGIDVARAQREAELQRFIDADQALSKISDEIEEVDNHIADLRKGTKDPLLSKLVGDQQAKKKQIQKQFSARLAKLKKANHSGLDPETAELQARIAVLTEEEKWAASDVEELRQKAEKFGNSSVEVEMRKNEIACLDKILAPIAEEREKLKVELNTPSRVKIFQRAEPPKSQDGKPRWQSVATAGGIGFCAVFFLVLWSDVRKQRISSLADLSRGLGLTVVGSVPLFPQKATRAGRGGKRHRRWQNTLNHAVDSIAARLFLRKAGGGVRVVMVSSAMQGEGKTTLAVQLATRLARSGEPTLLVDYDLRRPSIHRIFNAPRGPGVSECLKKEFDLSEVVRPTESANLSFVTAGELLHDSLGPLSNGVTTSFFEKARAAFTFVVVDGSPILPVIDGLLVSQHADTVVLSVRRDTSQAPQVMRACEKLAAFGSRKYVVVLNGSHEEVCPDYQEQIIRARVEAVETVETAKTSENEVHDDAAEKTAAI